MRSLLISDRQHVIELFKASAEKIYDMDLIHVAEEKEDIISYIEDNKIDIAFLDMSSKSFDEVFILKMIKIKCIKTAVICILDDIEPFEVSLRYKADYFLLEPYTREDIEDAILRAKCLSKVHKKRVYFRTFGRFDMFVDEKIVHFRSAKAKELLALCVDRRGGIVKMEEAIDKLWENRAYDDRVKNLYRHAVKYIRNVFKEYHIEDVFKNGRGVCCLRYDAVDCDLFYYIENASSREKVDFKFTGSYLSEYTWAEDTIAMLERLKNNEKE